VFLFRPKIQGELGYYGLGEWWLSTFIEQEREYIERKFTPMGGDARPLTQGEIIGSGTGRASQLLWGLATWFRNREDFFIAVRILKKVEEIATDPLDLHFTYSGREYPTIRECDCRTLNLLVHEVVHVWPSGHWSVLRSRRVNHQELLALQAC
jgi:hypothetical protein